MVWYNTDDYIGSFTLFKPCDVNDHPLKRVACEEQADVDQFALRSNR